MVRLLLAVFCVATTAMWGQESIQSAGLSGRVLDPSGAAIPGATVTVRQTDTNVTATMVTGTDGGFRFPYLSLGNYEVKVERTGFADSVRTVTLTVGSSFDLPISLGLSKVIEEVHLDEDAPIVLDTMRTQIAGTIARQEIADLPLNGRSFLDVALLIPGVSPTNTASTQLFPETSAVAGQGISVSSQRNFSNSFVVDGLSANDDAAGLSGVYYGLDTLHEFQVVTSGGQAEFGRAMGGYINMVTKSGTNMLHGGIYGYFRNQRLNARNALSATKLPLTQAQYGASLGGPIRRDRTFYFANFERRDLNQSGLVTIAPESVAAINTRLDATGFPGPRITTGLYPNPVHSTTLLGKVDHQFSNDDHFSVRYSLYDVRSDNSRGVAALNATSAAAGLDNTDHAIAMSNIWTLTPRLMNETRGQFTESKLSAEPNDLLGPSVSIASVASFGRLAGSPTRRANRMYEVVNNLSYAAGPHLLRFGANFLFNNTTITYPRQVRGSYAFSSLATFLSGAYNNQGFTQTFGNSVVPQTNPNVGFFVQDEWKLHSRLTLNLGLRYDLQFLKTIATDTNNVSPRAGFAWTPFVARKTVVRGSWGLFYDRVPLRAVANVLLSSGNTTDITATSQLSVGLSPTQVGAPVFPNIIGGLPANVLVNFTTMDPRVQNAYSQQRSVEIEQQMGASGTISVGYQYLRGQRLIASLNQNVPACVAAGSNNGCRPNGNYANNSQYRAAGDSRYNGLIVSFVQRPAKWGHYRVSYAYSKALNNVGEAFFNTPIDQFNIWQDWGRSDDDQRHRLVFNGAIQSHGFQLSGMMQYYSALPLNITTGANTVQGTAGRPVVDGAYIPRNSGVGFNNVNVNTRLSRTFHLSERLSLEGIAEAFNALNRVNGVIRNGVFGTGAYPGSPAPTFQRTTAVADPRTFQLALRIAF